MPSREEETIVILGRYRSSCSGRIDLWVGGLLTYTIFPVSRAGPRPMVKAAQLVWRPRNLLKGLHEDSSRSPIQ